MFFYKFSYVYVICFFTASVYKWFAVFFNLYYLQNTFNVNNTLLLTLSVFWNSKSFFFLFFVGLCVVGYLVFLIRFPRTNSFLPIPFFFIFFNYLHYFNLSNVDFFFKLSSKDLNYLLMNTLNSIHPPLLYLSAIFLILPIFFRYRSFIGKQVVIFSLYFGLVTSILSIFLGSWWASQESNWGGWWNWDPSETLSLSIFFSFIFILHLKSINFSYSLYFSYFSSISTQVIFLYSLVQSSFSETSHSFIENDDSLSIYYLLFFSFNFSLFYFFNKYVNKNTPCLNHRVKFSKSITYIFILIVVIFINSLIGFIWMYLGLKILIPPVNTKVLIYLTSPLFFFTRFSLKLFLNFKFFKLHLVMLFLFSSLNILGFFDLNLLCLLKIKDFFLLSENFIKLNNSLNSETILFPNLPKNHYSVFLSFCENLLFSNKFTFFFIKTFTIDSFFIFIFIILLIYKVRVVFNFRLKYFV